MSKLAVFVRLKTSKLYFKEKRSVSCVSFTNEMSARLCHDWRKMLRWPFVKSVSKVSPAGIAPPRAPGLSKGTVKQEALSATSPFPKAPDAPVTAFFAVQPGARGTIGLVRPL